MKLPDPRIEAAPDGDSDLSATIRVPELSDRPIQDVESRSVIRPAGGLAAPEEDLALGATLRSDEAPKAAREALRSTPPPKRSEPPPPAADNRSESLKATVQNLRNQRPAEPAPAESKGLSSTTVVLLILVAFIAGGAIAAWVAKTYLVKGSLEHPAPTASLRVPS